MNKIIIALLKPLSFLPALVVMYMIFSFSGQSGADSGQLSYTVSVKLVQAGAELLNRQMSQSEIDMYATKYNYLVRKAAHMTEYCVLAISLCIPLYAYGVRGIWLLLLAGFICVGFAATDEYHQSHVEGRGPSVRDVFIDSCGALIGIIGTQIIGWAAVKSTKEHERTRRSRNRNRNKSKHRRHS
jgi:VanZ family protein